MIRTKRETIDMSKRDEPRAQFEAGGTDLAGVHFSPPPFLSRIVSLCRSRGSRKQQPSDLWTGLPSLSLPTLLFRCLYRHGVFRELEPPHGLDRQPQRLHAPRYKGEAHHVTVSKPRGILQTVFFPLSFGWVHPHPANLQPALIWEGYWCRTWAYSTTPNVVVRLDGFATPSFPFSPFERTRPLHA